MLLKRSNNDSGIQVIILTFLNFKCLASCLPDIGHGSLLVTGRE